MAKLSKPTNFNTLWSQNGSRADVSSKQAIGWQVEIPEREVMNGLQYRQDYGVAYLLQTGVPEYDVSSTYYEGNLANVGGVLYKCLDTNQGVNPTTSASASRYWERVGPSWGEYLVIYNRINSPNPFPQYITVSNPYTPEVISTKGIQSSVDQNKSLTFTEGVLQYRVSNTIKYQFSNIDMPTTDDTKNVATTEWVQALIAELRVSMEVAVGESIVTNNPNNPATYKGYGTWVLDCQGRALVGVSSLSGAPSWTKAVDNNFGTFDVTLTESTMPTHNHYKDSRFNKLVAISGDTVADATVATSTASDYDFIGAENEVGIGQVSAKAKLLMSIKDTGGGQPHNNVQPSQTKYIWTRTG
jgi:microcystin-dependent protein